MRPPWDTRLAWPEPGRIALGLALGALGGALADWAQVPLAWMLGALFALMFATLAGAPVSVPMWLRAWFMLPIGLFLGESFDGVAWADMARWPASIALALLYVPVGTGAAYLYYRHLGREAPVTAACSAVPGGLSAVVMLAGPLGAEEARVALAQSLRIAIVVCLAPAIAFGLLGYAPPTEATFADQALIGWGDLALLGGCSVAAALALARARVPIPQLMGALVASAGLRMSGVVTGVLPHHWVEVALVVTGASIGARFQGTGFRRWLGLSLWTLGGTLILMAVSGVFALGASVALGIDLVDALLAYAPGGVSEMSLIALAIDADAGFVAVHHVARIAFILALVPLVGAWALRRRG